MLAIRPSARNSWLPSVLVSVCAALFLSGCGADAPLSLDADQAEASASGSTSLGQPSDLTATAVSASRIDVTWKDNASRETGFQVQRSTTGPSGTFTVLETLGANVTTHGDDGLTASAQYCYKVRAFRRSDGRTTYSAFSNVSCGTTKSNAPSNVDAKPTSSTSARVTWSDNSLGEDGFRVERSLDRGVTWAAVGTTGPGVTSLDDGERTSEAEVCYRVVTVHPGGDSEASALDCTAPPAGPSGLTATKVDAQAIDLVWTDNSGIEHSYEVQRSSAGAGGPFTTIAELAASSTHYRDGGLTASTTYWYRVRAKRDGGVSDASNVDDAQTDAPPPVSRPAAPSQANGMAQNSTTVEVTWADNADSEDGFRVERSESNAGPWEAIGTNPPNATRFTDTGRASEREVCYRVIAFNRAGDSDPSNVDCSTPPAPPTSLTATALDDHTILVRWLDNSSVEEQYEIQRATAAGGPYYSVKRLIADANEWRDDTRPPQTTFWYRARAWKGDGASDFSNVGSATTPVAPPPPPGPPAAPSTPSAKPVYSSRIEVTWADNSTNEDGFRLERSTDGGATWVLVATTRWGFYEDQDRVPEQKVCYRASAFNGDGVSPVSSPGCTTPPAAPTIVDLHFVDGEFEIVWLDNSAVEDGYEVRFVDGWTVGQQVVGRLPANTTRFRPQISGAEYVVWYVYATKDGGYSDGDGRGPLVDPWASRARPNVPTLGPAARPRASSPARAPKPR